MKYYRLQRAHNDPEMHVMGFVIDNEIFEQGTDGVSLASYPIPELQFVDRDETKTDFLTGFSVYYVVSSRLRKVIEESGLEPNLEFIEIIANGKRQEEYWFMNPINSIDCLDLNLSEYTTNPSFLGPIAGKVAKISKFVIDAPKVENRHLFRPVDNQVAVLISEKMVQLFQSHNITGYVLRLLDPYGKWPES
jgi:hypothetical protein